MLSEQILSRRYDCDLTKRVESQQIFVAGDDDISYAIHGEFKELVVLRIAARSNRVSDRHDLSGAPKQANELLPVLDVGMRRELAAAQRIGQLGKGRIGNQQLTRIYRLSDRTSEADR